MMLEEGDRIDKQCVTKQIHVLAGVAEAVSSSEIHRVLHPPVDRLRVVAPRIQGREVLVGRRDGPNVLGPVEAATVSWLLPWRRTATVPPP